MLNPLNHHYAMENPASVYDEEALTALELAGRTTAKVNECVKKCNDTETHVQEEIDRQDTYISERFDNQDAYLTRMHDEEFPRLVREEFNEKFEGAFDDAMTTMDNEARGGYLNARTRTVFTGDSFPTFTGKASDDYITVTVPSDVRVYLANGKLTTVSLDEMAIGLSEWADKVDGKLVIRMPQEGALYFDIETGGFCIDSGNLTAIPHTAYIVLYNYYGNLSGEWWVRNQVKTMAVPGNGFVYVSSDARINMTKNGDGNGSVNITVNNVLNIVCGGTVQSFPWEDISTEISDYITIDGVEAVINVPYRRTLVFNLAEQKLYIRSKPSLVTNDDVILAQTSWDCVVGGWLLTNYLRQGMTVNTETMNDTELVEVAGNPETTNCRFIFFTDPHLCQKAEWKPTFHKYMGTLKKAVQETGIDMVISGGDWLGHDDTREEALAKLHYVNGYMRDNFRGYLPVMGNHDTNYQGVIHEHEKGTDAWTGMLNPYLLSDLFYTDEHGNRSSFNYGVTRNNSYFEGDTFVNGTTNFIIINTQCSGEVTENDGWLNNVFIALYNNLTKMTGTVVLVMHIPPLDLSSAFRDTLKRHLLDNMKTTSGHTAKIGAILCGHKHQDFIEASNEWMNLTDEEMELCDDYRNIPVIGTTHFQDGGVPSFDICNVTKDVDGTTMLTMHRVGTGEDRTIVLEV